jgi:hypothetical protein
MKFSKVKNKLYIKIDEGFEQVYKQMLYKWMKAFNKLKVKVLKWMNLR